MKNTLKFLSVLWVLCLIFNSFASLQTASAETFGGFEYEINEDDTVTITKYKGTSSDVTIPAEIGGKPVKSIGFEAFYWCNTLKSVIISEGVESIYWDAFTRCHFMNKILIPKSVTYVEYGSVGYTQEWYGYQDENGSCYDEYVYQKIENTTIYCYKDSEAEKYAKENGLNYILVDEENIDVEEEFKTIRNGDFNIDGTLDISDVAYARRYIIGDVFRAIDVVDYWSDPEKTYSDYYKELEGYYVVRLSGNKINGRFTDNVKLDFDSTDMNNDGVIDILDIVMMRSVIVS